MNQVKIVLAALALGASSCATAGMLFDRHVVWFNLANDAKVDARIKAYLDQGSEKTCWEDGSLLFMRDKPKSITSDLVTNAVVRRDKGAIRELDKILKRAHGEATVGFDGIIVYSDSPRPTLYSMAMRPIGIRRADIGSGKNGATLEQRFCSLAPPISRPP